MRDTLDKLLVQHEKRQTYKKHYMSTKVKCTFPDGTTKIFNSITEASKETGATQSGISGVCSGINHKAGGCKWEYYVEKEDNKNV